MLFGTEEKNMMIGAFTSGALQSAFDAYFGYRLAGGVDISNTPVEPTYWLYTSFNYWLPNLEQTISLLAVPALFFYMGKRRRSSKLRAMGVGGLVFGVSEILGTYALKIAATASGAGGLNYKVIGAR